MKHIPDRPVFLLALRPEPHVKDVPRALRRLLKATLRYYGFRCLDMWVQQETPGTLQ